MVKFVYFDIGNVFHTTEDVFSTVAKDFNIEVDQIINIFDKYDGQLNVGKMTVSDLWKICCGELKIKNGKGYDFAKAWVSDYKVIPQMHLLAQEVVKKYKVGLLTNHYVGNYSEMIKQHKIPDLKYSAIVNSSEVHCKKPDPEIYKIAEERCEFSGSDILFIDDKKENLFTASKMGWQTFLMDPKNPKKSCEEIGKILLL